MPTPPWELPDDKLLAECRFEAFVGPGPGGQKRHKTNAAVRYTHRPSGIHAVATDSRSQRENRIHALRELRHKLAMETRREIPDPLDYRPPAWWGEYPAMRINAKNPRYPSAVAEVLDVLAAMRWELAALKETGRLGKVQVVGFDTNDETLAGIEAGTVHATMMQSPYQIGYEAMRVLADAARGDKQNLPMFPSFYLACEPVTKSNLEVVRQDLAKKGSSAPSAAPPADVPPADAAATTKPAA